MNAYYTLQGKKPRCNKKTTNKYLKELNEYEKNKNQWIEYLKNIDKTK